MAYDIHDEAGVCFLQLFDQKCPYTNPTMSAGVPVNRPVFKIFGNTSYLLDSLSDKHTLNDPVM